MYTFLGGQINQTFPLSMGAFFEPDFSPSLSNTHKIFARVCVCVFVSLQLSEGLVFASNPTVPGLPARPAAPPSLQYKKCAEEERGGRCSGPQPWNVVLNPCRRVPNNAPLT